MTTCCCQSMEEELTVEVKHATEWMKNLPRELHNEPITKIAIPGTHDSFAFYLTRHAGPDMDANLRRLHVLISSIIKNWSITQNLTFAEQLYIGIRYFDLRVCRTTDSKLSSKSPFTFTHGLLGGLVREGLEEINEFLNKHPKEIILLDFNHFYDFNDQCGHEQLIELIHEIFGKKICTTAETILECTLNYLWNNQQQVILLYERNRDQCSAYMDRIGHFFQICQSPWPNTPRTDNLFLFLDEKVSVPRSTTCINVIQGQITPDTATIQNNPFSSLETHARETNRRLIEWLSLRQRDPSLINGVNVVICDFADQLFADTVIKLNHKNLTSL
ncbi:unnamed protein product [Adineta steineri]|uniref:Phosphatidylinositol-specific phospholipase C X domain-containing protein n=1 Tax=Adineta steineri TaxID=433720 RepID=A0A814FUD4_9BILA|nr:unnamed protein product [Adineta steineri]CAF1035181.1 unnamed protein product [Adineta steineri]CAF3773068.1 unnamed protein product [Adineta steineri]CAF4076551.1 unnamed protein product [Adineta steineri]